jgi:hypothetical protein
MMDVTDIELIAWLFPGRHDFFYISNNLYMRNEYIRESTM